MSMMLLSSWFCSSRKVEWCGITPLRAMVGVPSSAARTQPSRSTGSDKPIGDSSAVSEQDKLAEYNSLEQALYEMLSDAGTTELDDPGDEWYRGISSLVQLNSVTTGDGWYDLRDYFVSDHLDLYNTYDIHISGIVYISQ